MYKTIAFDEDYVRGIHLYGKIDKTSFINAMREVLPELESKGHFNLYFEMEPEDGITGDTLWESFKYGLTEGKNYVERIDKIAVVTDKAWLRGWTKVENAVLPGVKEKAFTPDEREEAKNWIKAR